MYVRQAVVISQQKWLLLVHSQRYPRLGNITYSGESGNSIREGRLKDNISVSHSSAPIFNTAQPQLMEGEHSKLPFLSLLIIAG
jgi:hypothetical protein